MSDGSGAPAKRIRAAPWRGRKRVKDARTQEYNLNVQYAFSKDYVLEVGYVGTQSIHRLGQIEFNQSLLASPENPVNGATTNSVNNVTTRQFYQGVPQGSLFSESVFIGNYNSLQISISKRLNHGLQFQASYVWSKNLDELNGEGGTDVFESQLPSNDQFHLRQSSYGLAGDDRAARVGRTRQVVDRIADAGDQRHPFPHRVA